MKSLFKYLTIILTLATSLVTVSAATPSTIEGLKEKAAQISESQDELASIKDNGALSAEDKLQKEISARKQIIADALSLSLQETGNLRGNLEKLTLEDDSRESELRNVFLDELNAYDEYYSTKATALKNAVNLGLGDVKAIAKEIIAYRDAVYNTSIKNIVDFLLLFYGQDAVSTAQNRIEKMSGDIKKLERLNLIKPGAFRSGLEKAAGLIKEAGELLEKARALILAVPAEENETADATPADSDTPIPTTSAIATGEPADEDKQEPTANELLTASLNKVKSAYEVFLQISKDIKKAVGIK